MEAPFTKTTLLKNIIESYKSAGIPAIQLGKIERDSYSDYYPVQVKPSLEAVFSFERENGPGAIDLKIKSGSLDEQVRAVNTACTLLRNAPATYSIVTVSYDPAAEQFVRARPELFPKHDIDLPLSDDEGGVLYHIHRSDIKNQ